MTTPAGGREELRDAAQRLLELAELHFSSHHEVYIGWRHEQYQSNMSVEQSREWHATMQALRAAMRPGQEAWRPAAHEVHDPVELGAVALWKIGNERIGYRPWESVAEMYRKEARAVLNVTFPLAAPGEPSEEGVRCSVRYPRHAEAHPS